jgi:hypothetical protein
VKGALAGAVEVIIDVLVVCAMIVGANIVLFFGLWLV